MPCENEVGGKGGGGVWRFMKHAKTRCPTERKVYVKTRCPTAEKVHTKTRCPTVGKVYTKVDVLLQGRSTPR